MADSESRQQRAAALEEKRRRLEELKQRRTRRDQDSAAKKAATTSNLDEYIDGLLKDSTPGGTGAASSGEAPRDDEVNGAGPIGQDGGMIAANGDAEQSSGTAVATTADGSSNQHIDSKAPPGVNNVIAEPAAAPRPKVVETFTIATQTDEDDFVSTNATDQDDEENPEERDKTETQQDDEKDTAFEVRRQEEKDPKLLSAEEVEKEVAAPPFSSFINTASKKVERLLGTPLLSDLLVDYVGEMDGVQRTGNQKDSDAGKFVSSRQVYECAKWTQGRDVTDMDWSPLHRELVLSTYHMPSFANIAVSATTAASKGSAAISQVGPNGTLSSSMTPRSGELQSDGLALVWSLAMPTRPEHIFTCGSPVTAGRFHPSESTLVVGGCESGQLVVWDVRAGRLPVQKSALTSVVGASGKGHVQAISLMEVIEGGAGLVTASGDGKLNFWSLANLREPAESMQIGDSISSFAVAPESETLLLGDEHGSLFAAQSSSSQTGGQRSSRRQVRKLETTDSEGESMGHFGMITSLSTKTLKKGAASRAAGLSKGFLRGSGGLILSSGVDWTAKLWAPAYSDAPLLSLVSHSYDYMSDVKWSPSHPSLFATASSNGSIGLWNLASSLEEPLTGQDGIVVEPDAMSGRGLNKLKWSQDGRRLAIASLDRVHLLSLSEEVVRVKGDEESKIMNQLLARGLIDRQ